MSYYVRIPMDRIGVILGPDGTTKARLEELSGALINVDSESGGVEVDPTKCTDPLMGLRVRDTVKAMARGFTPDEALPLIEDPDLYFELMDIRDYSGKSKDKLHRLRGRLIGTRGKTRRLIHEQSGAYVVIHGHTVGLLGRPEELETARIAVDMILNGAEHSSVYRFLEGRHRAKLKPGWLEAFD